MKFEQREAAALPNKTPVLTEIKVATGGEVLIVEPLSSPELGGTDEIFPVYGQYHRCDSCAEHASQSPKLSLVCVLQRWEGWWRHKLRLHFI